MTYTNHDAVDRWASTTGMYATTYVNEDTVFQPVDAGRLRVGEHLTMRYASRRALELHIAALCDVLAAEDAIAAGLGADRDDHGVGFGCQCGKPLLPGEHRNYGPCLTLVDGA